MTVLKNSMGRDELACDGCGRTDAGPGQPLSIETYTVHNPNVGSATAMHYCPGCAGNRGLAAEAVTISGWNPVVPTAPEALDEEDK